MLHTVVREIEKKIDFSQSKVIFNVLWTGQYGSSADMFSPGDIKTELDGKYLLTKS